MSAARRGHLRHLVRQYDGGGRRNQVQDLAFQFIQKGASLTGKLYLDYGSAPILKGTIDGDKIAFQVVAREQAGNEINQSVLRLPAR